MSCTVKVCYLNKGGEKLYKSSPDAVGYGLFSTHDFVIEPNEMKKISTDIELEMSSVIYAQIAEKSSVTVTSGLRVCAGVIDPDYQGQIYVVLHNTANQKVFWKKCNPLAQLIFHIITKPCIIESISISDDTYRGDKAFGQCTDLKQRF